MICFATVHLIFSPFLLSSLIPYCLPTTFPPARRKPAWLTTGNCLYDGSLISATLGSPASRPGIRTWYFVFHAGVSCSPGYRWQALSLYDTQSQSRDDDILPLWSFKSFIFQKQINQINAIQVTGQDSIRAYTIFFVRAQRLVTILKLIL